MSKIIAFAGLDGSGKTTQAKMLKQKLEQQGNKVFLCNPMHHPKNLQKLKTAGELLKVDYEQFFGSEIVGIIHLTDVWNYLNNIIQNYQMYDFIICERYLLDFYVYSTILKSNLEFQKNILDNMDTPALYIYLDIDPDIASERVSKRKEIVCKRTHYQTLPKTRKLFLKYITRFNNMSIKTKDYTPEQISNIIITKLKDDRLS